MDIFQRSAHLLAFALEHPWATTPEMLTTIGTIVARHLAGEPADQGQIQAALIGRSNRVSAAHGSTKGGGATAVLPFYGVVAPRMNLLSETSGGVTFEGLTAQVRAAAADPRVARIVFDVDSPGGNVAGASEFARALREAAVKKPVIAVANHLMASAAYWAMSGATEIVASPSAMIGSIGVLSIHDDLTAALEKLGIKRTIISAGRFKAEAHGGGPLSAEAQAHLQQLISTAYGRMAADIARGRGVPVQTVRSGYGEGRLLDSEAALHAGLVNRIATLDEVLLPTAAATRTALDTHRQALREAAMVGHRIALESAARTHRAH
jgi:signal peptide peptidase SppA